MFSIVILTYNEEENLPACFESIAWCDDVWVVDSFSTDRTVEIAKSHGAKVVQRAFDNFGNQRNFAIDTCAFKYEWIFDLDADERFTDELKTECEERARLDQHSAYWVANKMMLWGKWIRHASGFPVYQMRFHKLGEVRFISHGHGQRESEAVRGLGYLREPYVHYNFSKGVSKWFEGHVRYAKDEALESMKVGENRCKGWADGVEDPLARRRMLKRFSERMPCRPFLKFLFLYVFKMGFLDGCAGLAYCLMQAHYEFMIVAIRRDLTIKKRDKMA